MGNQQYLPPMVPSVAFPGTYIRYPPAPQLVFPFLGQKSIVSRRATSKTPSDMASHNDTNMQSAADPNMQHPGVRDFLAGGSTSSSLSKEEVPIPRSRGATREFLEDDSTTSGPFKSEAPARKPRGASQKRRDSLTQQSPPPASLTKRSRLPSNDISRKAPLRAASSPLSDSEDEDYNDLGRKRPKAKQQRLSAKPNGAVSKKRAQHPSTPAVDPKNILNRRREADITDLERYQQEPPRQLPEVGLFSPPNIATRSRPRHKYMVPGKLQGTATALGKPLPSTAYPLHLANFSGPDTWNEYIVLMERLVLGEISEPDFDKHATPLFQLFNQKTRHMLNRAIREDMIFPVLGREDEAWKELDREKGFETKDSEAID
jgi:hypothetical protein